jgi:Uma2 family endonuclease
MTAMTVAAKNHLRSASGLVTAEELFRLGDDVHAELVEGVLVPLSPAGFEHGDVALAIGARIRVFAQENHLGRACAAETGFVLSRNPDTVLAPDVGFVVADRIPPGARPKGFFQGAPDLAVEVLSPSNRQAEITVKIAMYFQAGTRLVWIIDPIEQTVAVHRSAKQATVLNSADTLNGEDVLPGFRVLVATIFE